MKKDRKSCRDKREKRDVTIMTNTVLLLVDDEVKAQSSDNAADADSESSSESEHEDTSLPVKKEKKTTEKEKNN